MPRLRGFFLQNTTIYDIIYKLAPRLSILKGVIHTSGINGLGALKARQYQKTKDSANALMERVTNLENQLKSAQTQLERTKAEIRSMESASKLPILVYTNTYFVKGTLCGLGHYETSCVYYLPDINTSIKRIYCGNEREAQKKHLRGTLDLTDAPSICSHKVEEAIADIRTVIADLINRYKPRTWTRLKKPLIEHYLKLSDS